MSEHLLSPCLLPKLDDANAMELVLRDRKDFGSCSFTDLLQSLQRLQCPNLTSLFLYKDFLSDLSPDQILQFYETLSRAPFCGQLEELSLSFVKLSVSSLALMLERMPLLRTLYLGRTGLLEREHAPRLYRALRQMKHLKEFHCSLAVVAGDNNEEESLDELLESLAPIPTLQTLYLAAQPRGAQIRRPASLQALSNSTVLNLTLKNIRLHTPQHVRALLHQGPHSFQSLALFNAQMGDAGAQVIVEQCLLFPNDGLLRKLYLPGNQLTDIGGNAIARSLIPRLQVLALHDNRLTASLDACMGAALQQQQPHSLEFLDVSSNPLGDAGGIALACALADSCTLQKVNLFDCQLSDGTCLALATALRANRRLRHLNLYRNPAISLTGVDSLLGELEHHNYVLERLEVQSPRQTDARLEFWLTLNRKFGRQSLFRQANDQQYLQQGLAQANQSNDFNSLFYFLKAKPTLCHAAAPTSLSAAAETCSATTVG